MLMESVFPSRNIVSLDFPQIFLPISTIFLNESLGNIKKTISNMITMNSQEQEKTKENNEVH